MGHKTSGVVCIKKGCGGLSIYPASPGVQEENRHHSSARMASECRHPSVVGGVVKGAGGAP